MFGCFVVATSFVWTFHWSSLVATAFPVHKMICRAQHFIFCVLIFDFGLILIFCELWKKLLWFFLILELWFLLLTWTWFLRFDFLLILRFEVFEVTHFELSSQKVEHAFWGSKWLYEPSRMIIWIMWDMFETYSKPFNHRRIFLGYIFENFRLQISKITFFGIMWLYKGT